MPVWGDPLAAELPETSFPGEAKGLTRYAVQLTDPATGKTVTAVAADSEVQRQLADVESAMPFVCGCVPCSRGNRFCGSFSGAVSGLAGAAVGTGRIKAALWAARPRRE